MFNNLATFYGSKEWQGLLAVLKQERLNDDGQIICAHCGKPIVNKYDIIGHHVEELTEENVNDYEISLNPSNIQFLHFRCHQAIHDRFAHHNREVFLVYGAPLSGKKTWVRDNMSEGDMIINIDNIWQCVSNTEDKKPKALKAIVFKMRDVLLDTVKYRLGYWRTAFIVGGYPLQSERDLLCKELGARQVFIDTPKEECLARAKDATQADMTRYIEEWFNRYGNG